MTTEFDALCAEIDEWPPSDNPLLTIEQMRGRVEGELKRRPPDDEASTKRAP